MKYNITISIFKSSTIYPPRVLVRSIHNNINGNRKVYQLASRETGYIVRTEPFMK